MKKEIDEFGELLVRLVRDKAIRACDGIVSGKRPDVVARHCREHLSGKVDDVEKIIPDIVDTTVAALLEALDQGLLPLIYVGSGEQPTDLYNDGRGELVGWYLGADGWRSQHSKERYCSYFN